MEGKRSRRRTARARVVGRTQMPGADRSGRRQEAGPGGWRGKPYRFSFKREGEWMSLMNFAPFVIGVLLALIFWFTR